MSRIRRIVITAASGAMALAMVVAVAATHLWGAVPGTHLWG